MQNLAPNFKELIGAIALIADEKRASNPVMQTRVRRYKITSVDQRPNGLVPSRFHIEEGVRLTWHKAEIATFEELMHRSEYTDLIREFGNAFGDGEPARGVIGHAVQALIADHFAGSVRNLPDFIAMLRKDVANEPVLAWSEIEIRGFELLVPNMDVSLDGASFHFRQREIADFEKEISDFGIQTHSLWDAPACVLKVEMPAQFPIDLQMEAAKAEAALRLFSVCGCTFESQTFGAESVSRWFMGATGGGVKRAGPKFQLEPDQEENFKHFWRNCLNAIPATFYNLEKRGEDFLKIAYDRYCDALFHVGRSEGKIAFAMMGLEAVFLRPNEKEGLKYSLSLRLAKSFSKIGLNFMEIRDHVRIGYNIRSTYVHGGHLSANDLAKFDGKSKPSIATLSWSLLNTLRISILLIALTRIDKEKFLNLIEDSLLDGTKDAELDGNISGVRHLLNPDGK